MTVIFKFEIGAYLYSRQHLRAWHERYGHIEAASKTRGYQSMGELSANDRRPMALLVIERHLQQCYGGIQLHYWFRDGKHIVKLTEAEVTADFNDPSVGALVPPSPDTPT